MQAQRPPSPYESLPTQKSSANAFVHSFKPPSTNNHISSPLRRKPLPPDASPLASRFSSAEYPSPKRQETKDRTRAFTVNSPPPGVLSPPLTSEPAFAPRNLDEFPHGETPLTPTPPSSSRFAKHRAQLSLQTAKQIAPGFPGHGRAASTPQSATFDRALLAPCEDTARSPGDTSHVRTPTMSSYDSGAPDLKLHTAVNNNDTGVALKKSPSQKLTSFFGWKSNGQSGQEAQSPSTNFSDNSRSVSPISPMINGNGVAGKPSALDIPKANTMAPQNYFTVPGTPLLSSSPAMNAHVEELERELRELSSELAGSVRREMELEEEVERWRLEHPGATSDSNKRTSDYFSDSGASSSRYLDSDQRIDDLEKLRRKVEQEKADLKVQMAEKVQEELRKRRDLEEQVQSLEEQVQNGGGSDRVRELESTLETARRQLADEKHSRGNFEDLLTALREELEENRNERDNLRDEVVPELQSRVDGLEIEAAHVQQLTFENARLSQENHSLRNENNTLVNARRTAIEMQQQGARFRSISEEDELASPRVGLSRANSVARSSLTGGKRTSLSRSNSVKGRSENIESVTDRMKDIEEQRDALHNALKALLSRHDLQQQEHKKHIKLLETERDRALNATPRRTTFNREVTTLREEINMLRRRADDALEQKWQCEKGLGGLKMDLERAEQETMSLRDLLSERNGHNRNGSISSEANRILSAVSLDKALGELRTTHALSIARIKGIELEESGSPNSDSQHVLELLKQSISEAEAERDSAQNEAEVYREQARALQKSEMEHLGKEKSLSSQLYASAQRMDELASQVHQQLQSNKTLRTRLAEAIGRGETDQQASAARISELQNKLRSLEDNVWNAQQQSDEMIGEHEEEVKQLRESENVHLQRSKKGFFSPASPSLAVPSTPFLLKSPRLDKTTSGPGVSLNEATRTGELESKVTDLEKALSDADSEMQTVISKMNTAQMEVAELQAQRDDATRQTRRLQAEILAEREKVKALTS